MPEITWTRESELWLKDIFDYIAVDDPVAAARTLLAIYEKAKLLKTHPRLGHKYEMAGSREVRILLYEHYRITYLRRCAMSVVTGLPSFTISLTVRRDTPSSFASLS